MRIVNKDYVWVRLRVICLFYKEKAISGTFCEIFRMSKARSLFKMVSTLKGNKLFPSRRGSKTDRSRLVSTDSIYPFT